MAAIPSQLNGFRLFAGEIINSLITICNNITGNGATGATSNIYQNGTFTSIPQILTAVGATQGAAAAITKGFAVISVATTNSLKGVRLPTAVTGLMVVVGNVASHGVKVYPASGGRISTTTTNTADLLLKNKTNVYRAVNTTLWVSQVGA